VRWREVVGWKGRVPERKRRRGRRALGRAAIRDSPNRRRRRGLRADLRDLSLLLVTTLL
jgi:hypothetical protein